MRRPGLKRRRIPRHGRKIAIMQPVQHLLLLAQSRPALPIFSILARPMPQRCLRPILVALAIVRFFPAAAHKKHVAGLDVAALGNRPNVDALVFTALVQLLPRDGVVVVGIVVDAFFVGVASVVK